MTLIGGLAKQIRSLSPWSRRVAQRALGSRRPHTVTIDYNRLELFLNDFVETRSRRGEALGWLGLIAGLVASLVSADFTYTAPRFGMTGTQWQTLLVAALAVSVIGLIRSSWSALTGPTAVDFLTAVGADSGAVLEERAIFLIKRNSRGEGRLLLSYKSATWNCFLLPNAKLGLSGDLEQLPAVLADKLGIDEAEVTLSEFDGSTFVSNKHSEYFVRETTYEYRFFLVELTGSAPDLIARDKFTVRGREFIWKSLAEMQSDLDTFRRNGDILKYISERSEQFLVKPPDTV